MVQTIGDKIGKTSLLIIIIAGITYSSGGQKLPSMPYTANQKNSLEYEWAQKKVYKSKKLTGNENLDNWQHKGFGSIALNKDKYHDGQSSLLIKSPTKGNNSTMNGPKNAQGRPWGASSAVYSIGGEDWSDWNRISFWVYPDLPGFRVVSLGLIFHNEGKQKVPDTYRDGLHFQILENHKWNKVYWEIEHLSRDKVTAIEFSYRLQGNEPEATKEVKYYIDEVFLEKVNPDYYEGWDIAPGHIAYNHLGYVSGMSKTALASNLSAKEFALIDSLTGREILRKSIVSKKTPLGMFQVMDFGEMNQEGTYFLKAGNVATKPFRISSFDHIYRSSVLKTINHFYTQRCGYEIPGIHAACHGDWTSKHNDKMIVINGGWHDAGDLSQGLINTSEAVYAMFTLA
ncbi:MAG: glycoside hydrolase family 9 protein, partial [Chitinophagaceae bacterium]